MPALRAVVIWGLLGVAVALPLMVAATSPLLAYRDAIYILGGFAGIIGMALLLVQPLLAGGYLPGLRLQRGRGMHRWGGGLLVLAVVLHVAGLWLTSPPDVVDALLFRSPTPFAVWGVVAMWALFAAATLAVFHRRLGVSASVWRAAHTLLVSVGVVGSVVHAILIEGAMGQVTKVALCLIVLGATLKTVSDLRVWKRLGRRRAG